MITNMQVALLLNNKLLNIKTFLTKQLLLQTHLLIIRTFLLNI